MRFVFWRRVPSVRFFISACERAGGFPGQRERERKGESAHETRVCTHIYQWQRGEAQTRSSPVILGRVLTSNMRPVQRL